MKSNISLTLLLLTISMNINLHLLQTKSQVLGMEYHREVFWFFTPSSGLPSPLLVAQWSLCWSSYCLLNLSMVVFMICYRIWAKNLSRFSMGLLWNSWCIDAVMTPRTFLESDKTIYMNSMMQKSAVRFTLSWTSDPHHSTSQVFQILLVLTAIPQC